jgi:hypothetical protein
MKKVLLFVFGVISISMWIACNSAAGRYIDLNTGKHISIEKDPQTGYMVDADTKKPVDIYVDTETKDTVYGRNGKVINGKVVKTGDGVYEYHYVSERAAENAGDIKIKDGDVKIKIKDGEKKVKRD